MANYEAYARSNYFRVTDSAAFSALCARWSLEAITTTVDGEALHGFLCEDGLPSELETEDDDATFVFDDELAAILAPGSVAVMQEIGFEKMRYLSGFSRAINSAGESVSVSIDDIYDRAKTLGAYVTDCAY
jgi:hypothetical protein